MVTLNLDFTPTDKRWYHRAFPFLRGKRKGFGKSSSFELPTSLSELTRSQAIRLARVYSEMKIPFSPPSQGRSDVSGDAQRAEGVTLSQRFACLQAIMNLADEYFFEIGELAMQKILHASPFATHKHHILTGEPVLKYITNPFPFLRGRMGWGWRYHLPSFALSNAPQVQFNWAEEYYQNIANGEDFETNLNGLCSALCSSPRRRLALWITQFWPAAGKVLINWSRITCQNAPFDQKFAVLMYYFGTRQAIRELFSPMFSEKSSGSSAFGGPDLTSKYRWWALTHDLAEKGVFGGFDTTCYTNLHDVLHHTSYNSDKYREHELKSQMHGRS